MHSEYVSIVAKPRGFIITNKTVLRLLTLDIQIFLEEEEFLSNLVGNFHQAISIRTSHRALAYFSFVSQYRSHYHFFILVRNIMKSTQSVMCVL